MAYLSEAVALTKITVTSHRIKHRIKHISEAVTLAMINDDHTRLKLDLVDEKRKASK